MQGSVPRGAVITSFVVALIATLTCSTSVAQAASPTVVTARASTVSNTDHFDKTRYVAFPEQGMCLHYEVSGDLKYTARRANVHDGTYDYILENIRVAAPRVTVKGYRYDSVTHACSSRAATWKKLVLTHAWRGYSCSWSPSISVGTPWAVGLSFWPSCSSKKTAHRGSTYGSSSSQTQLSSQTSVKFAAQVLNRPTSQPAPKPRCYGVAVRSHLYTGGKDDIKTTPRLQVCPTPRY